jgi:hypothetical protein
MVAYEIPRRGGLRGLLRGQRAGGPCQALTGCFTRKRSDWQCVVGVWCRRHTGVVSLKRVCERERTGCWFIRRHEWVVSPQGLRGFVAGFWCGRDAGVVSFQGAGEFVAGFWCGRDAGVVSFQGAGEFVTWFRCARHASVVSLRRLWESIGGVCWERHDWGVSFQVVWEFIGGICWARDAGVVSSQGILEGEWKRTECWFVLGVWCRCHGRVVSLQRPCERQCTIRSREEAISRIRVTDVDYAASIAASHPPLAVDVAVAVKDHSHRCRENTFGCSWRGV